MMDWFDHLHDQIRQAGCSLPSCTSSNSAHTITYSQFLRSRRRLTRNRVCGDNGGLPVTEEACQSEFKPVHSDCSAPWIPVKTLRIEVFPVIQCAHWTESVDAPTRPFSLADPLEPISEDGDPLEALAAPVEFERFYEHRRRQHLRRAGLPRQTCVEQLASPSLESRNLRRQV